MKLHSKKLKTLLAVLATSTALSGAFALEWKDLGAYEKNLKSQVEKNKTSALKLAGLKGQIEQKLGKQVSFEDFVSLVANQIDAGAKADLEKIEKTVISKMATLEKRVKDKVGVEDLKKKSLFKDLFTTGFLKKSISEQTLATLKGRLELLIGIGFQPQLWGTYVAEFAGQSRAQDVEVAVKNYLRSFTRVTQGEGHDSQSEYESLRSSRGSSAESEAESPERGSLRGSGEELKSTKPKQSDYNPFTGEDYPASEVSSQTSDIFPKKQPAPSSQVDPFEDPKAPAKPGVVDHAARLKAKQQPAQKGQSQQSVQAPQAAPQQPPAAVDHAARLKAKQQAAQKGQGQQAEPFPEELGSAFLELGMAINEGKLQAIGALLQTLEDMAKAQRYQSLLTPQALEAFQGTISSQLDALAPEKRDPKVIDGYNGLVAFKNRIDLRKAIQEGEFEKWRTWLYTGK